jgi:Ca2+:H+ antiporter
MRFVSLTHSYAASLVFQLWSHSHLYADEGEYAPMKSRKYPKSPPRDPNHPNRLERTKKALRLPQKKKGAKGVRADSVASSTATAEGSPTVTARTNTGFTATSATAVKVLTPVGENAETVQGHGDVGDTNAGSSVPQDLEAGADADSEPEKEEETPQLTAGVAFGLLAVVTVVCFFFTLKIPMLQVFEGIWGLTLSLAQLVAVTAEFLVSSIDGLTSTGHISEEWVGLILLPIVGNAAEHVTAVTVSYKDKLDLSIGVAVGSSIQIALFVIPVLVLLGWIMGKPLTMLFDPFESIVLFLSVLTVAFCINDGWSNWLEGMILMSMFSNMFLLVLSDGGSSVRRLICHSCTFFFAFTLTCSESYGPLTTFPL